MLFRSTSLAPAFDGGSVEREAIYWEHEGNRAIRQGRWKLVARHRGDWELYDLEVDPGETTDVAASHPEVVARMSALADRMRARLGDGLTGVEGTEVRRPRTVPQRKAPRTDEVDAP